MVLGHLLTRIAFSGAGMTRRSRQYLNRHSVHWHSVSGVGASGSESEITVEELKVCTSGFTIPLRSQINLGLSETFLPPRHHRHGRRSETDGSAARPIMSTSRLGPDHTGPVTGSGHLWPRGPPRPGRHSTAGLPFQTWPGPTVTVAGHPARAPMPPGPAKCTVTGFSTAAAAARAPAVTMVSRRRISCNIAMFHAPSSDAMNLNRVLVPHRTRTQTRINRKPLLTGRH